jgi:fatty acid desaturase
MGGSKWVSLYFSCAISILPSSLSCRILALGEFATYVSEACDRLPGFADLNLTQMEQHWTHHSYTNHDKKDPDIRSGEPLMILVDYPVGHPKRRWYHMFQAFFALPLLSLYWLSVVFSFDIIDLKHAGAVAAGMNFENEFVVARRKYARLTRLLYAAFVIYPPFYHHGLKWTPFFHLIAMGAFGSIFISVLFIISHNFESVQRNPMSEARAHGKKVDWYKMQVETSCTYGGFLSGCLTGGLNFQIEHHLFPRMSSAWYPYISPTVREVCKKHGVKYVYYPWIWQNIISTVKHIHSTGNRATETKKSA